VGRGEDARAAAEASLPAFGKCAGVGAGRDSRGAGTALLEAGGSGAEGLSVSSQANSLTARFARRVLAYAVRYWPEENRAWGLALAAEIDETGNVFETVRWSLGGVMLFTRSVLSSAWKWMKLPAGGALPGGVDGPKGSSLPPRRSRVFTAAVLAAAALLLALPEGREAIRTVGASWHEYQQSGSDARTLEQLADRAEKEKDASTLAFVALSTRDPKRAEELIERAVALDPQLVWVYGSRNHRADYDPPQTEWLARLHAADPDNAVPYLLEAYALDPSSNRTLYQHGAPKDADFEAVESDSKWMALMERAYDAPRYDSYFQSHYRLTRAVWNREKNLSPAIVLSGLWSQAIPNLLNLRMFADVEIHEAQKARASGDLKRTESLLAEVDTFGIGMADGSATDIEKLIAWVLSRNANKEMAVLYSSSGKTEDERRVTARLDQIEERVKEMRLLHNPATSAGAQTFRRKAILVQGFGTLAVVAGFAALAAILLLELFPRRIRSAKPIWRRAASLVADYAPAVVLIACSAFLVSFLPFQSVIAEYRGSNYVLPNEERLMDAMWGLFEIPQYVTGVNAAVSTWTFVTVALSALLLFVLVRGFYRMRCNVAKPV
jgi:tetratricopeptide (TPR) repeat protein